MSIPPSSDLSQPLNVFISYSHRDEDFKDDLLDHLAALKRQMKVQTWKDKDIEAGTEWENAVKQRIETAEIILLLISSRFLASDYCYDFQMQRAIESHDAGTAYVIPILLKPVDWQGTPFSKLKVLPENRKAITQWSNQDEAFQEVAKGIREVVESLQRNKVAKSTYTSTILTGDKAKTTKSTSVLPFSTYKPTTFIGRYTETKELAQALSENCRLLLLYGMTGIGKTALAESLANQCLTQKRFCKISLPTGYVQIFLDRGTALPHFSVSALTILEHLGNDEAQQVPEKEVLSYFLKVLEKEPCWLQLDSLESLLCSNNQGESSFVDPIWLDFLEQFLINPRLVDSRLILTSQVVPVDWKERGFRLDNLWQAYSLQGLTKNHQLDLFRCYDIIPKTPAETNHLDTITHHFEGHPQILKMIAGDMKGKPYNGDISKYWQNYYQPSLSQQSVQAYNGLEQQVINCVHQIVQKLPHTSRQMLQQCSVFRRPVPESFYTEMAANIPNDNLDAALRNLRNHNLVEDHDIQVGQWLLCQHNLIRKVAYAQLKTDLATWEMSERRAAQLWLTVYSPADDCSNLESVCGYLEAFNHYCEVEDWEEAIKLYTKIITSTQLPLHMQLLTWSYYKDLIHMSKRLAENISSPTKRICLNQLGNAYRNLGQIDISIDYYQQAFEFAHKIKDLCGESRALGCLGLAYNSLSEYPKAIESLQKALLTAREIEDCQGELTYLGNLGMAYYKLDEINEAISHYQQALALARKMEDRLRESRILGNLGNAYKTLRDYQQAIHHHHQHLNIAREIGDRQGEGNALCNLGDIYHLLENYQQAIVFHQQALETSREINDRQGEGQDLGNLGLAHQELGDYSVSANYHQQHVEIARDIQDPKAECKALSHLGKCQIQLHQHSNAIESLQTAVRIARQIGNRLYEATALISLAQLHQRLGESATACNCCQQALFIANEISALPLIKTCQDLKNLISLSTFS